MSSVDLASCAWLTLLLAAVLYVGGTFSTHPQKEQVQVGERRELSDVTGTRVPRQMYRHIASASALADRLLLELAEPERIVARSQHGKLHDPDAYGYRQRAQIAGPGDLETLIALGADVLLVNQRGATAEIARVRAAGIQVFDLGETRGLATLRPAIYALAELVGDRARGERLWQRFIGRLHSVSSDVAPAARKQALYVANYAGKLYGGTRGTSYHDVLAAAGLNDVAAAEYRDWPVYDPEQLLALDPALIVTHTGMARALCDNVWLARLRACSGRAANVLELAPELIGDAGLGMLDAAERLHELAYAKESP